MDPYLEEYEEWRHEFRLHEGGPWAFAAIYTYKQIAKILDATDSDREKLDKIREAMNR